MKKILLAIFVGVFAQSIQAQISIGPKIGVGAGSIKSRNLKENLDAQRQMDPDLKSWDVKNTLGLYFGLGGFLQYNINDNFALVTELTYNGLSSKIKINYEDNNVDGSGNGDITRIESEARIKVSFFSVPLLAKYSFSGTTGPYVLAGLRLNFLGTPEISSEETRVREQYFSGSLVQTSTEMRTVGADVNVFKSTRLNFVLGGGTTIDLKGKNLSLDLRYNLPLTKSEMYTTSVNYDDMAFKNNEVFSVWGKTDAELDAPGFRLNDFKMGFLELSVSYALFQK